MTPSRYEPLPPDGRPGVRWAKPPDTGGTAAAQPGPAEAGMSEDLLAEIERASVEPGDLDYWGEMARTLIAEVRRLRARVVELEADVAYRRAAAWRRAEGQGEGNP